LLPKRRLNLIRAGDRGGNYHFNIVWTNARV
jgi:hypothetical protein